ncbi:MAG TPA: lysophospholipid acyltransferase family protein, partial [Terriglobales bacterium]|nr:lysophospholipid acyltransferase family protein [Terriglobales bacterium]
AEAAEPIALGSSWLAAWRLLFYVGLTLALLPPQLVFVLLRLRGLATRLPLHYHRLCCRIFGFEIIHVGEISKTHPTLFVANHSSYLDIPVLGATLPASFVAKTEVASWPGFGLLAKLQRTVFVDRKRGTTDRQRDDIQVRLEAGDNLVLFPEGTSNDGNRVLPFRSALLSVAESSIKGAALTVQPVSVSYTGLNGVPLGHGLRPLLAWYGDMTLGPHLWAFCRLGRVRVVVEFHPTTTVAAYSSRKDLTRYCFERVANGVASALAGQTGGFAPPGAKTDKKH